MYEWVHPVATLPATDETTRRSICRMNASSPNHQPQLCRVSIPTVDLLAQQQPHIANRAAGFPRVGFRSRPSDYSPKSENLHLLDEEIVVQFALGCGRWRSRTRSTVGVSKGDHVRVDVKIV
eukprot:6198273-Pleurochrysis_carterae.AAC.1